MTTKRNNVVRLQAPQSTPPAHAHCIGKVVSWSREGGVLVDFTGNVQGPLIALSTVAITPAALDDAVQRSTGVLLAFDGSDSRKPIIVGFVSAEPWLTSEAPAVGPPAELPIETLVDGKKVVVEGADRVELRCGKASLVLTKSGQIFTRGTYISSQSTGTHRIRGGSVDIN